MTPQRLSDILKRPLENDPVIAGVTADSRKVGPGALFAALPGSASDGRAFIPQAVAAGAAAILTEQDTPDQSIPVVRVHDVRRAYALAAPPSADRFSLRRAISPPALAPWVSSSRTRI
jgi:UDP-N-acetylmuramoyl-L-alanyl-D-glutamate--2,6-diaminopimelate ligase